MTVNQEGRSVLLFGVFANAVTAGGYFVDMLGQPWTIGLIITGWLLMATFLFCALRTLRR